jgi:hypothetical protein
MLKVGLLVIGLLVLMSVSASAQVLDAAKIPNSRVKYVQPEKLKEYPTPVLQYIHISAEHSKYIDEIIERIIYPFLREHDRPVAAVTIDFCPVIIVTGAPDIRACEGKIRRKVMIDVIVKEQNGAEFTGGFELNTDGHFDKDAYKNLLINPDYKTGSNSPPEKRVS